MASGHVNRVNRPNTWLHRPMLQTFKKVLANSEPSTHGGKADMPYCAAYVCFDPKRTSRRDLIGARFDVVIDYFVIMRLADGGAPPGAAGEITNVSQAFQPSGLCSAANSP